MADTKHDKQYHDPGLDRFEKTDASFVSIGIWMIIIVVLVLLTAFAAWGYFNYFANKELQTRLEERSPLLKENEVAQQIPGPVLQLNPTAEMQTFTVEQDKALSSYSWVSKEAGVVRLPIDVAIKKVLQPGVLQSRSQNPETTATVPDDGASLPQDSSSGRTFWNLQR